MPGQFLTTAEQERWERFPCDLSPEDLAIFFTLSASDRAQIPHRSAAENRLGFALQLCALRYLGFCPDDLSTIPPPAVAYVAQQLGVDPADLTRYGARAHTCTDHFQTILAYMGFRKADMRTLTALQRWLTARALEHDRPTLLLQLACEKLRQDKVLRPGLSRLERLVITARNQARHETARRVAPLLTDRCKAQLDALLIPDEPRGYTQLAWLQHGAVTASPSTLLATVDKLVCLALVTIVETYRRLRASIGGRAGTVCKLRFENIWRIVPFMNWGVYLSFIEANGPPVVQYSMVWAPPYASFDTMKPLDLDYAASTKEWAGVTSQILRGIPILIELLHAFGIPANLLQAEPYDFIDALIGAAKPKTGLSPILGSAPTPNGE
jgi:hypothetical protein